jgi:hypothetical protein
MVILFLEVFHVYKTLYYSFQISHCLLLHSQYTFHYKKIFLSVYFIIFSISISIYILLLYISTYIFVYKYLLCHTSNMWKFFLSFLGYSGLGNMYPSLQFSLWWSTSTKFCTFLFIILRTMLNRQSL